MSYLAPSNRYQYTISVCLDDLISKDNPVRLIDEIVEQIVKENEDKLYPDKTIKAGRPEYPTEVLLKLFIYGYKEGISSSRKLEKETHRNQEMRWLTGDLHPDHWTISNFRKENIDLIKTTAKLFRRFLLDNKYINCKTVAIDGTKVKGNTSMVKLNKEKIEKYMKKAEEQIDRYFEKLEVRDIVEDITEVNEEMGGEEINEELVKRIITLQKQIENLQRAKQELEDTGREITSITDPETKIMQSKFGKIPAYNVQMTVDSKNRMIADSEVTTMENDYGNSRPMIESLKEEIGKYPEEALFDGGYNNLDMIESLEKEEGNTKCYVPNVEHREKGNKITFKYDKDKNEVICSEGKRLKLYQRNKKRGNSIADVYIGVECSGCKIREKCTKSERGRTYHRYNNQEWRDNYVTKMKEEVSQRKLRKRKGIVEHVFGIIKTMMGKIPLLLRGKRKVSVEIDLYTIGYNLKRLINIEKQRNMERIIEMVREYNWKLA